MSAPTLPHSLEAEAAVLGSMLFDPRAAAEAAAVLDSDMFYRQAHRLLFDIVARSVREGNPYDVVSVVDELHRQGRLDEVGGAVEVHRLVDFAFPSTVRVHADTVRRLARLRRLAEIGSHLSREALKPGVDPAEVADRAAAAMLDQGRQGDGIVPPDEVAAQVTRWIAGDTVDKATGVPTPWRNVNRLYMPPPGRFTVVTGPPGAGKSEWVNELVVGLARDRGWRVGMFAAESGGAEQHAPDLLWTWVGGDPRAHLKGVDVDEALSDLSDRVRWIDDLEDTSLPSILARARLLKLRGGLDGLVVDPWNKVRQVRSGLREDLQLQDQLREVVLFARREGVHVWVVAHPTKLERLPRRETLYRPSGLYDVSGGSEWANQADAVLSVWRNVYGEPTGDAELPDDPNVCLLRVLKIKQHGRWGRPGQTSLVWSSETRRFGVPLRGVA